MIFFIDFVIILRAIIWDLETAAKVGEVKV